MSSKRKKEISDLNREKKYIVNVQQVYLDKISRACRHYSQVALLTGRGRGRACSGRGGASTSDGVQDGHLMGHGGHWGRRWARWRLGEREQLRGGGCRAWRSCCCLGRP